MVDVEFDFARFVARRRGQVDQRARDGAAYSYPGERKVRRTLSAARPVSLAIEATTRLWKSAARGELLGTAVRVSDQQFAPVQAAAKRAAKALGIDTPTVYVAPTSSSVRMATLGTDDDAYVVIRADLVERLTEGELVAVIGHECGNIQNNHVIYATALHYLTTAAVMFVRWIVQPAVMALQAWSRRAEITCDRAALLCCRDPDVALSALVKVELGLDRAVDFNVDEYLRQLPEGRRGIGRYAELFRSHPYLPKRVQALRLFADSAYYRRLSSRDGGAPADTVDAQVAEILSVFR